MLSRARIKFIKSLQLKKYRKEEQCFVVEGAKGVEELLSSDFEVVLITGTASFLDSIRARASQLELIRASPQELKSVGRFETNNSGIAVARMKTNELVTVEPAEFALALDDISDPGNLGTIIRVADWYGVKKIIASTETADLYNGKVIQASMGSFTRVHIYYCDLRDYLASVQIPVWGAFTDGDDVHGVQFGDGGVIVIGNEARGVTSTLSSEIDKRVGIPRIGGAESLNAAVATAIILDNIRRDQKNP